MKKILSLLSITLLLLQTTFAASVQDSITKIQTGPTYSAPGTYEDKGFVGNVLSQIFWPTGLIRNQFITAFQIIEGLFLNNIPRWDGVKFVEGTIYDVGGNIGIGTSTPAEKLEVNGAIRQEGSRPILFLTDTDTGADNYITGNSTYGAVGIHADVNSEVSGSFISFGVDGTSRLRIAESGNIGIGTSTPDTKLQVLGGTDVHSDVGGYLQLGPDNAYNIGIDNNEIAARNNGVPSTLYLNGTANAGGGDVIIGRGLGFVGVGGTSPTERLDVNGKIRMRTQTDAGDSNDTVATKGYVDTEISNIPSGTSCNQISWSNGFELTSAERPNGNRFMVGISSTSQRCRQLGYDFGTPLRVFRNWCSYSNARVAEYQVSAQNGSVLGWTQVGCSDRIAVERALCCNF